MNDASKSFWKRLITLVAVTSLLAACVFSFFTAPLIMCLMDGGCAEVSMTSLRGMYARTIAVSCFVSTSMLMYRCGAATSIYEQTMDAHEVYSPTTMAEHRRRRLFCTMYVTLCMSVILPINTLRLTLLIANHSDPIVLVFFVLMYLENVAMCLGESCFVTSCHTLGNKFVDINRDLQRLGEEMAANTAARRVTYDADFYRGPGEQSIANAVEVLRIRHQLIRDAVSMFADLFGGPVGLSLFTLGVMTLFDIYYQVSDVMGADSRLMIFIYMWLLQYTIRFYAIVVSAHNATKQVSSR